jgi:hypothetical protein
MAYESMTTYQLKALIKERCIAKMNKKQKFIAMLKLDDQLRVLGCVLGDIHDIRKEMNDVDNPTSQYSSAMEDIDDKLNALYDTMVEILGE